MSTTESPIDLPRWSVADVHESLESRSFNDAMERLGAETTRLVSLFDEHDVRATDPRPAHSVSLAPDSALAAGYLEVGRKRTPP